MLKYKHFSSKFKILSFEQCVPISLFELTYLKTQTTIICYKDNEFCNWEWNYFVKNNEVKVNVKKDNKDEN